MSWLNKSPEMPATSVFFPWMSSTWLLPRREALRDQQVGLTKAPFELLLLTLRPRTYEVLCAPFRNGVYFPQHSGSPECMLCWPSRANVVGFVFPVQDFQFGEPQLEVCGVQIPCSFGRTSTVVIILPFVGHPCGGIVPDCTASLSLLRVWLWFLYVFSCRSLLAFWSFSSILAL